MKNNSPLVTVMIPFYNCAFISQAINSVLRQTYKQIEIILVNDGSTEEYKNLLDPYLSKITYIEQSNQGVASALNQGLKHANGDFVAWLSSDDLFDDRKIEVQLEYMLENQLEICFTNFNHINENGLITNYNVGKVFANPLEIVETMKSFCPINGCTVMMSRKVWESVGDFDITLKFVQDYDYWIRTSCHFPIHYLHSTLTNYRVHRNMGTKIHYKEQMKEFYHVRDKYSKELDLLISKLRREADV
ncbi:glycosyltransferase [Paucisalibacillus sp. EB02]|uniref:glycosyltransferase family 2 protein n=1 Tax=Paucisalibacillus sp. EB02 TaxID=1347087 RepID=UPI0004BC494A|nr:glycosyltransferase [Paucisalibacillus sp. EB02]